jgi:cation diffusion facilitator family transporter
VLTALRRIPAPEQHAALLSIGIGVTLMGLKFGAYFLTGSTSVFSDALESIVNVLSSIVALTALSYAHRPPDADHPYGHGKAEFVSAAFEGGMIIAAAAVIVFAALHALIDRHVPERLDIGMALVTLATIGNGVVGLLLLRIGRARSSMTLEADGRHLLADAITSIGALVALLLVSLTGLNWLDPLFAILIAFYIAREGLKLLRRALGGLLDQQDAADEREIVALLDRHVGALGVEPAICGYHKVRHRHSGRYHWIDFHIQVPRSWSVAQGHAVASAIEHEIEQKIGQGNATAHVEPCDETRCDRCGG